MLLRGVAQLCVRAAAAASGARVMPPPPPLGAVLPASALGVRAMCDGPSRPRVLVPEHELDISFARSSGPGGQNVNKVNTKVTVRFHVESATWLPDDVRRRLIAQRGNYINALGEMVVHSTRTRSQHQNRLDCIAKLQQFVDDALVPERARIETEAPEHALEEVRRWKERRAAVKDSRRSKHRLDDQ